MSSVGELAPRDNRFVYLLSFVALSLFLRQGFMAVSIIALSVYAVVRFYRNGFRIGPFNKLLVLPVALYLLYAAWTLLSAHPSGAPAILETKAPLLVLPVCFVLAGYSLSDADKKKIYSIFLFACVAASMYCLAFALYRVYKFDSFVNPGNANNDYFFAYDFLTDPIRLDPIYFAMYCDLAVALLLFTDLIANKYVKLSLTAYLSAFIVLVASKMGILILGFIFLLWMLTGVKSWIMAALIAVVLGATAWFGIVKFPFLVERFMIVTTLNYSEPDDKKWGSTAIRLAVWSCASEAILRKPIVGYGTGGGQPELESIYEERNFIRGIDDKYNPHNEFLSTALDLGIGGTVVLVALSIIPSVISLRKRDMLALCFSTIVLSNFLIECVFNRQKGVVFFALFCCVFFSADSQSKPETLKDITSPTGL